MERFKSFTSDDRKVWGGGRGTGDGSVEVGVIVDFSLLSAVNTQSGKGGGVL